MCIASLLPDGLGDSTSPAKSVLNLQDFRKVYCSQSYSCLDKGRETKLKEKQQESIRNGQDVNLWESLSSSARKKRTLCRCASEFLLHFCFMITLCLINSCFVVMPRSVLEDWTSTDYLAALPSNPPDSRVSQISVDHVESQKFPLVTCNGYGKFTCIDTWTRISLTLFPSPSLSFASHHYLLECCCREICNFYLWLYIFFLFNIN